jgi:LuxR family transcriptional regulator, maltose regulon positive regulatory protein
VAERGLRAREPAEADGGSRAAMGRLLALRAIVASVTGPGAERIARDALDRIREQDHLFRALALQAAGMAQWSAGNRVHAVETWRLTLEAAMCSGQPIAILPAVTALSNGLNGVGRRPEAEALCRSVLEAHPGGRGRSPQVDWLVRMSLGLLRYEANDLAEARRELEHGFAAARTAGGGLLAAWALEYLALARQATGSPQTALEVIRDVSRATGTAGLALPANPAPEVEARIRLLQGHLPDAARWADGLPSLSPTGQGRSTPASRLSHDLTLARVRLAQGRADEARAALAEARATADRAGAVAELISIGVLAAVAAEAMGRRVEARQVLAEAIRLAAPGGYVRRFVDDGTPVAHLLAGVRTIAPDFVDQVVAAIAGSRSGGAPRSGRGPSVLQDDAGELFEALTERERDVLRLIAQGASNADIAAGLAVSVGTARWHVANILAKLGVKNRTQALVRARSLGLV